MHSRWSQSKYFWPTIKPFITNKGSHFTKNIIFCEKDEIINDQNMAAKCFNYFFINVAKDIGNETVADKNHPSIIEINKNKKRYT